MDKYLTTTEVAEHFRVSKLTVYKWIEARELTAMRFGGKRSNYRISEKEVERFTRAHTA